MNLFTYIKERISIVTVAQEYVTVKKAGIYYKGPCPFHQEKDASFTISPHKEIFYCFGCHATGDVISFIAQIEGCNQFEAAKLLIDKYGIDIPPELLKENKNSFISADQKNRYYTLCSTVAMWCSEQLKNSPDARSYIDVRKINKAVIRDYTIGYFPSGATALKQLQNYIQKEGFLIKDLIDAHIIIEGSHGLYSPYEERIIFPITDHLGRSCGFGGRIFKENDERAKYYNSRENEYFNKGTILFGLHEAKKAIQKKERAFLVEGYTDCLAMVQHGYPHTIATLGTACTYEHLKQLSHYADYLYVLYDGDKAGLKAMLRLTQLCWNVTIDIRIIPLPEGEDPASFLGAGNTLDEYINQAHDVFSFFIKHAGMQYKNQSLKKRLKIVKEIIEILASIKESIKQTLLLQDAAHHLDVPFDALKKACIHASNVHNQKHAEVDENKIPDIDISTGEKQIFSLIIYYPELCDREEFSLLIQTLASPLRSVLDQYKNLKNRSLGNLLEMLNDNEKSLTNSIVIEHDKIQHTDVEHEMYNFMKYRWKMITHITKEQISEAQKCNDNNKVMSLLQQLQQLKKKFVTLEL